MGYKYFPGRASLAPPCQITTVSPHPGPFSPMRGLRSPEPTTQKQLHPFSAKLISPYRSRHKQLRLLSDIRGAGLTNDPSSLLLMKGRSWDACVHMASGRQLDRIPRFDVPISALQVPAEPCETTARLPASLPAFSWTMFLSGFPDRPHAVSPRATFPILGVNPGATPAQKPAPSPFVLELSQGSVTLG